MKKHSIEDLKILLSHIKDNSPASRTVAFLSSVLAGKRMFYKTLGRNESVIKRNRKKRSTAKHRVKNIARKTEGIYVGDEFMELE